MKQKIKEIIYWVCNSYRIGGVARTDDAIQNATDAIMQLFQVDERPITRENLAELKFQQDLVGDEQWVLEDWHHREVVVTIYKDEPEEYYSISVSGVHAANVTTMGHITELINRFLRFE